MPIPIFTSPATSGFPGIFPMVPGHEIVGTISAVGSHVKKFSIGHLGGVGVMVDSCRDCEDCRNGQEQFCTVSPVQTYNNLGKDGLPVYGGYSNTIVVNEDFVHHISEKLDLAAVAPLLCAGITTYSPLRKWNVGKGHKTSCGGPWRAGPYGCKVWCSIWCSGLRCSAHRPAKKRRQKN